MMSSSCFSRILELEKLCTLQNQRDQAYIKFLGIFFFLPEKVRWQRLPKVIIYANDGIQMH